MLSQKQIRSLELLRQFVEETPKDELADLLNHYQQINPEGVTYAHYLTELGEGKFIQFINDGNEWSFYVNEDTDGFEAKRADKRGNSRRIHNSGLVVMILKSFGFKNSKIFYIEKTAMTKDNCPIFKMIINKV